METFFFVWLIGAGLTAAGGTTIYTGHAEFSPFAAAVAMIFTWWLHREPENQKYHPLWNRRGWRTSPIEVLWKGHKNKDK